MILQKILLSFLPIARSCWLVGFPRFGFAVGQESEASQLLPQMVGLIVGNGRLIPKLHIQLVDNGRLLAPYQPVIPQKEAFVRKNIELEQGVMAGGSGVGVKWIGQNGR